MAFLTSGLRIIAERGTYADQVEEPAGQGKGTANEHKIEEIGSRKLISVTRVISGWVDRGISDGHKQVGSKTWMSLA